MGKRIKMHEVEKVGYQAMLQLEKYIESTELTKTHKELIKIRASQVNGCSFCIDMHTKDALKAGETVQRIMALMAWRETPFFTEEERAILALTEEVTLISNHVSDETYNQAAKLFSETYLAQLIMAIVTINAWNRIGISTQLEPSL